ncbi:hypothetical protein TIFTF001_027723 [Ficus carica]|uniref:RING-type domain-containing protein n=1 Tax=Ficus carica TaxID=3494 RepID=A0AA88IZ12_FICCA|nr:hypothetical protein TIFTF001_043447 [Ficus carica]GMN58624.1 hypothetical protein TIFTF001_027723 [Ficus carica]
MDISPTTTTTATPTPALIIRPPPPFPAPPRSVDLSALEFILGLIAVISIPALIYTFFFAVKCPPDTLRRRRHHRESQDQTLPSDTAPEIPQAAAAEMKYSKEAHAKELGGECPVCLSAFAEGEEVKKLSACEHAFHAACIDPWLSLHANCPVCRASIAVNATNNNKPPSGGGGVGVGVGGGGGGSSGNNANNRGLSRSRHEDFHQGMPDAANLV